MDNKTIKKETKLGKATPFSEREKERDFFFLIKFLRAKKWCLSLGEFCW